MNLQGVVSQLHPCQPLNLLDDSLNVKVLVLNVDCVSSNYVCFPGYEIVTIGMSNDVLDLGVGPQRVSEVLLHH